jgi:NAD(P)H-hydrate repair Nnr-like enzyme with NAD(P)H-hydrate epimerase domain
MASKTTRILAIILASLAVPSGAFAATGQAPVHHRDAHTLVAHHDKHQGHKHHKHHKHHRIGRAQPADLIAHEV